MSKHAVMPLTDYVNVCDALREKIGTTEPIKSGEIPKKVNDVYDMGQLATLKNSKYMNGKESGTIVSVNDVTPIEHNVGVKVASKNLFNLNSVVAHNNDISSDFVASGNSFTIRGNEGSGALEYNTGMLMFPYSNVANVSSKGMLVEKGVTYTVSFDYLLLEQGKYDNRIEILIYNDTLGIYNNKSYGGTLSATVRHSMSFTPTRDGRIGVVFRVNNNYVTISNIQIEVGTTATEYTPYISNFAGGDNLIPYPYPDTTKTEGGITFTDNGDGSITINGTATGEYVPSFHLMETKVFPKGNYIVSGNSTNGDMVVFLYGAYGSVNTIVQKNGTDATFNLTEDTEVNISFYAEEGASYNNVTITPQIVREDEIKVEVRKCGANLFPFGESVTLRSFINGAHSDFLPIQTDVKFLRNKVIKYSVYFDLSGAVEDTTTASVRTIYYDATGAIIRMDFGNQLKKANGDTQGYSTLTPLIPDNTEKILFGITVQFNGTATPDTNSFVTVSQGMITLGNELKEYEPYTETIYTANADGTVEGVKSISPNMTLIPNNNAVTVECEYLRDIDTYIDNLITNVALTGGE